MNGMESVRDLLDGESEQYIEEGSFVHAGAMRWQRPPHEPPPADREEQR